MEKVLLFYKYIDLEDPKEVVLWQKEICKRIGLKGRILIGKEGINGTASGTEEQTAEYIKLMNESEYFSGIDFKYSYASGPAFPKLRVLLRDEIVNISLPTEEADPKKTPRHLSPEEVNQLIESRPDNLIILDTRNDYEWEVGAFKGAVKPPIKNFREFPEYVDEHLEEYKDKQVLMYCTGGIRCERAAAYMEAKGVAKKVYQIEGGIHHYIEKFPEGHFRGKNYVFDARIVTKVNDDVLGKCLICNGSNDDYTNCMNAPCNKHFICCPACLEKFDGCCSKECLEVINSNPEQKRPEFLKAEYVENPK